MTSRPPPDAPPSNSKPTPGGSPAAAAEVARPRTLLAIGNFDGVHRGHQEVLASAARKAGEIGLVPGVLTFDPHPAVALGRTPPALLTTLARKIELIHRVSRAIEVQVRRFDAALASLSPEAFAEQILARELAASHVVVGRNFRFGHARAGDLTRLIELGQRFGFVAQATDLMGDERGAWSSTRVRTSIAAGAWDDVRRVLGRPHALSGTVIEGNRRGRTIGFPTANLGDVPEALPPHGVYAVLVDALDVAGSARALAKGVANVGVRPTVGAGPAVEAHLFDFSGDLYGTRLRIHLVENLRGERRFSGLDALKEQIARDAEAARALLDGALADEAAGGGWF